MTQINIDMTCESPYIFLFGVKSFDDLTPGSASYYTMNDIDVCYDPENKEYIVGFEAIYDMDDRHWNRYFDNLKSKFTEWMRIIGHSTKVDLTYGSNTYGSGSIKSDTLIGAYQEFCRAVEYFKKVGFKKALADEWDMGDFEKGGE